MQGISFVGNVGFALENFEAIAIRTTDCLKYRSGQPIRSVVVQLAIPPGMAQDD
jgi:hypothetical protein